MYVKIKNKKKKPVIQAVFLLNSMPYPTDFERAIQKPVQYGDY
jgi:hypothetical protein